MRPIIQGEAGECGIACLAMISHHFGYHIDLGSLRKRFEGSLRGTTLAALIAQARQIGLAGRAVRVPLEHLRYLRYPCILHWDLDHFVVARRMRMGRIEIFDPATGRASMSVSAVSPHFTGVALELRPTVDFRPADERRPIRLVDLVGKISGLGSSLSQIFALAILLEVMGLIAPFMVQLVVDRVLANNDMDFLVVLAAGFGLLLLVRAVSQLARSLCVIHLSTELQFQWSTNIFARLLRVPISFFERRHLGDIISRFGSIQSIQRILTTSFVEGVLDGIMSVATLLLMVSYNVYLALAAVTILAGYGLMRWFFFRRLTEARERHLVALAKEESHFLESIRGITTLRLFGRENERATRWQRLFADETNCAVMVSKMEAMFASSNFFVQGLRELVILSLGGYLVIRGEMSVGMLLAFSAYGTSFCTRTINLVDNLTELRTLRMYAGRLADIALEQPELPIGGDRSHESRDIPAPPLIEVVNLSFRYSESEPFILRDLSFKVAPGESIAIVGPSGAGKTTLVKLLLGIYRPTSGQIFIDSKQLPDFGIDLMRKISGSVMQDDTLFAGTLADNICCFDSQPDSVRIEECARLARIHTDIEAMPMKFHTLVGDMGSTLSGGQRQRILLARALYKQPLVLFLDEATSHLDIQREREVTSLIQHLPLTRIIIAHRPESVALATRVIPLVGPLFTSG